MWSFLSFDFPGNRHRVGQSTGVGARWQSTVPPDFLLSLSSLFSQLLQTSFHSDPLHLTTSQPQSNFRLHNLTLTSLGLFPSLVFLHTPVCSEMSLRSAWPPTCLSADTELTFSSAVKLWSLTFVWCSASLPRLPATTPSPGSYLGPLSYNFMAFYVLSRQPMRSMLNVN